MESERHGFHERLVERFGERWGAAIYTFAACLLSLAVSGLAPGPIADFGGVRNSLERVVRETMQPAHVSLWIRPGAASKGQRIR